jgi:hypothetical protein
VPNLTLESIGLYLKSLLDGFRIVCGFETFGGVDTAVAI